MAYLLGLLVYWSAGPIIWCRCWCSLHGSSAFRTIVLVPDTPALESMREREEPSAKALDVVPGDDSIFVHLWVHSLPTYLLTEQVSCFDAAFVHDISEIPRFIFPFDVDNQRPQLDCRLPNRTEPNRHFFHDFTFCMPLFGPGEDCMITCDY